MKNMSVMMLSQWIFYIIGMIELFTHNLLHYHSLPFFFCYSYCDQKSTKHTMSIEIKSSTGTAAEWGFTSITQLDSKAGYT